MKAVRYSMITMSLVLCFISVSCRNEDTVSEQFFDEDAVTVRLNLTTRGVETGDSDLLDVFSSDPSQWFKTGTLFPQAPAQPRIALMIFNRDLNRYVYNQLLPSIQPGWTDNIRSIYVFLRGKPSFMHCMLLTRQERIYLIILLKAIFRIRFHGTSWELVRRKSPKRNLQVLLFLLLLRNSRMEVWDYL